MNRACAARSSTFIEVVVGLGVVAGAVVVGAVAGVVAGIAAGVAGVVAGVVGGDDGHDGDVIGALLLLLRRWAATRVRRHDDRSRGPGLAWPAWTRWRAAEGGSGRRFLACLTVDRLVDHLLDWAARQIPEPFRERFAEEWQDHRTHRRGVRLVWWALCVRATASRTGHELRRAELPRIKGHSNGPSVRAGHARTL